jgi:hypothetical protein
MIRASCVPSAGVKETFGLSMKSLSLNFFASAPFFAVCGVMELLHEHVWRPVMESKQSQFWNAVSVAAFTVLAGILTGYVALLIVGDLPG